MSAIFGDEVGGPASWVDHRSIRYRFGDRVRELRRERKMSQAALAKSIGRQRTYISELENGKHNPSLYAIDRIAKGLGISLCALVSEL